MSNSLRPAILVVNQDFAGTLRACLTLPPEVRDSQAFAGLFAWLSTKAVGNIRCTSTEVSVPLLKAMPYGYDTEDLLYEVATLTATLLGLAVKVLSSDQEVQAYRGPLSYVAYKDIAPMLQSYYDEAHDLPHPLGDVGTFH